MALVMLDRMDRCLKASPAVRSFPPPVLKSILSFEKLWLRTRPTHFLAKVSCDCSFASNATPAS